MRLRSSVTGLRSKLRHVQDQLRATGIRLDDALTRAERLEAQVHKAQTELLIQHDREGRLLEELRVAKATVRMIVLGTKVVDQDAVGGHAYGG